MALNIKIPVALLSLLITSACEDGPKTCPLFDHPDEVLWDPAVPGDVALFANQAGDEIRFELKNTVDDVPAAVPARNKCVSYSVSSYYDDSKNVGFEVTFKHSIPDNVVGETIPIEEQFLRYTIQAVKEELSIGNDSEFGLENLNSSYNNGSRGSAVYQYSPTLMINEIEYNDVLERDISGYENVDTFLAEYPEDVAWVRVVVAKGVGLLQYELLNGEIYTKKQ